MLDLIIEWKTADLVTGTIKGYSYFTRENYNEEREPLGQEVLQYDPTADDDIGVPPANETINFWQDMQWQCEIGDRYYGGFWGMPFHCQMNVLQSGGGFLGDLLRLEEKNPHRINEAQGAEPPPELDASPADEILAYTLMATAKQDEKKPRKGKGKGKGRKGKSKKEEKRKKEEKQKPLAVVQSLPADFGVEPIDFEKDDLLDVIFKGLKLVNLVVDRVQMVGFNEDQEKMIVESLMMMLMSKKCADAFKTAQLPTPAEVIRDRGVLFIHRNILAPPLNNALKNLGFTEERSSAYYAHSGKALIKNGGGSTPDPNLPINLGMPATTILWDSSFNGGSDFSFSEIMIHETIHRSGVGENYAWYQYLPFLTSYGHDLTGYEHYESILKNCQQQ